MILFVSIIPYILKEVARSVFKIRHELVREAMRKRGISRRVEITTFAELKDFFEKGNVVVAISGSGNSKNVVKAVEYANSKGAVTIGLVGYRGGKLLGLVQIPLHIPGGRYADCRGCPHDDNAYDDEAAVTGI